MPINQPKVSQLCEALRDFLEQEVTPAVDDSGLKYKLKIAMNVLGIIARESELGDQFQRLERIELGEYLGADGGNDELNQNLLKHIQSADLSAIDDKLLAALAQITVAKMAIDNPRYASYLKHL